ncbi:MAG: hypothetical protein ACKV22_19505 [Bryobacteraceae bacterium]
MTWLLLSLWAATVLAADIPTNVRAHLDQACPRWQLSGVAPQIDAWFRQDRWPQRPNLVQADFDNDGRPDLAVEVICRRPRGPRQETFAFLNRPEGHEAFPLATSDTDPFTFLVVFRKGEKDFDFETMKPFRYPSDTLAVLYLRKTAVVFQWNGSGFTRRETPGDEELQ